MFFIFNFADFCDVFNLWKIFKVFFMGKRGQLFMYREGSAILSIFVWCLFQNPSETIIWRFIDCKGHFLLFMTGHRWGPTRGVMLALSRAGVKTSKKITKGCQHMNKLFGLFMPLSKVKRIKSLLFYMFVLYNFHMVHI